MFVGERHKQGYVPSAPMRRVGPSTLSPEGGLSCRDVEGVTDKRETLSSRRSTGARKAK